MSQDQNIRSCSFKQLFSLSQWLFPSTSPQDGGNCTPPPPSPEHLLGYNNDPVIVCERVATGCSHHPVGHGSFTIFFPLRRACAVIIRILKRSVVHCDSSIRLFFPLTETLLLLYYFTFWIKYKFNKKNQTLAFIRWLKIILSKVDTYCSFLIFYTLELLCTVGLHGAHLHQMI